MKPASICRSIISIVAVLIVPAFASALKPLHLAVTLRDDTYHAFPSNTYGLLISNQMDYSFTIKRGILVERQVPSGWKLYRIIQAVSTCEKFDYRFSENETVRIDPHGTLAVVPWDGWACKGQCLAACQQNVPPMPGTYRFIVVTVPGGRRVTSPTFSIEPLELEVTERAGVRHIFNGTGKFYGLKIENMSNHDVTIMRGISIWKKEPTGWSLQLGSIQAISKCGYFDENYRLETPVRIPGFGILAVVPWDGFLCGGQCPAACAKNYQLGPGTFRFEVFLVPEGKGLYSPSFTIDQR